MKEGQRISGFRLCLGLSLKNSDLRGIEANEKDIVHFVQHLAATNRESMDLVHSLSDYNVSVQSVAKQAGVSVRTLQRQCKRLGLPRPEYWHLLSRVRQAAAALHRHITLVEIAITHGYSDQAHMTRDFKRWFGVPPAQLRQDTSQLNEICQFGLGNWTAEQISIG